MKKLITMLNSYPGVNVNQHDFIFTKPVHIPHLKKDVVNVKSKLNSKGYIDQDFLYKRYDLDAISLENNYVVEVTSEETIHQLLYKLSKTVFFPYQEGGPLDVQDKYSIIEPSDIVDAPLPTITAEGTDIFLIVKSDSYYFRGKLKVTLKKAPYNNRITSVDFIPTLIIK